MTRVHRCLFALVLLASAACRREPAVTPEVDASAMMAERLPGPPVGPPHYRVEKLPSGHGYRVGQLLALYGTVENQPVGVAEIVFISEHSFELAAQWLDPTQEKQPAFEVRALPRDHHFGGIVGQVQLEQSEAHRVHLNMGKQQGLSVGSMFEVLADSMGRTVGLVQVVAFDGQVAIADILIGEAPEQSFVVYAGHETTRPRPITKVLVTRFDKDRGDAVSQALRSGFDQIAALTASHDIVVETSETIVTGDEQATRVGRDAGANVVVWGSASAVGSKLALRPQVTLIDAQLDGPVWEPIDVAAERVLPDRPDEISRHVRGLASYVAGLSYYTPFEQHADRSFVRAALHFKSAIEQGDAIDARNARVWLFYCLEVVGDRVGAEQIVRAAERDADERADPAWQTMVLFMHARRASAMQQFEDAWVKAEEVARRMTAAGNFAGHASAMEEIATIHAQRGELDEALRIRTELLQIYDKLGDLGVRADAMVRIAALHHDRGEFDDALRIRMEVLPMYERLGAVRARAHTMLDIADVHEARDELDEALRIRVEQLPIFEQLGDHWQVALLLGRIADVHKARGEFDEALRIHMDKRLPLVDALGDLAMRAAIMGSIAVLYGKLEDYDEALRIHEQEQMPIFEQLGDKRGVTFCNASMAVVRLMRKQPGDREAAATLLLLAIASAKELDMPEAEQFADLIRRAGL
jgi:tetratricopeptide (TPR) repeat protein